MKYFIKLLFFIPIIITSCNKEKKIPEADCTVTGSPAYNGSVKDLLDTKCATTGCHNAATKANGIDFSTYAVSKVHAANENFAGALLHTKGFEPMPNASTKLSDGEINLLRCWVKGGLKE